MLKPLVSAFFTVKQELESHGCDPWEDSGACIPVARIYCYQDSHVHRNVTSRFHPVWAPLPCGILVRMDLVLKARSLLRPQSMMGSLFTMVSLSRQIGSAPWSSQETLGSRYHHYHHYYYCHYRHYYQHHYKGQFQFYLVCALHLTPEQPPAHGQETATRLIPCLSRYSTQQLL